MVRDDGPSDWQCLVGCDLHIAVALLQALVAQDWIATRLRQMDVMTVSNSCRQRAGGNELHCRRR